MKIILVLLLVLLVGFIVVQIFAARGQKNIETYPYKVLKKYEEFEVRKYDASLFSSVKLPMSSYKNSSSKGFSILAPYIFGGNDKGEKIAMTSPVAMSLEDSMTMMFMVPKKYNKSDLPKPNQGEIEFKEVPEKTVAAIRFGGWADDEKIAKYKNELMLSLAQKRIEHNGQFYFLGYNPPYEVFNRKNEIIVELTSTDF